MVSSRIKPQWMGRYKKTGYLREWYKLGMLSDCGGRQEGYMM